MWLYTSLTLSKKQKNLKLTYIHRTAIAEKYGINTEDVVPQYQNRVATNTIFQHWIVRQAFPNIWQSLQSSFSLSLVE